MAVIDVMLQRVLMPHSAAFRGLMTAVLVVACVAPAHGSDPVIATGEWQVDEVRVDSGATRTLGYGPNDPRQRYRVIHIDANQVAVGGPEPSRCERPSWKPREVAAGLLWRTSFAGRGAEPMQPAPRDWGFALQEDQRVRVFELECNDKSTFGPDNGNRPSTWFLPLPDGRVALRWYDQTVLVLKKLAPGDPPRPSFDCARATSPAEKTICSSHELAGLDKSMSEGYRMAIESAKQVNPPRAKQISAAQQKWLHARNACRCDASCLDRAMRKRIDELSAEPG